ncbi:MAG: hypothetical protein IKZ82_13230 [Clostridia bacterium]|nr:hypothetical protein [Clostridia bacterium]
MKLEVKNTEYVSLMSAAQKAAFVQELISKLAWQLSYERFEREVDAQSYSKQGTCTASSDAESILLPLILGDTPNTPERSVMP